MSQQIKTYNNVIEILQDIATRHYQINHFHVGANWEIGLDENAQYPLLSVNPISATMERGSNEGFAAFNIVMQLRVLDINNNDENNEQDVQSDTLQILQDIITEFTSHPYYTNSKFDIKSDISFTPLDESTDENCNGWYIDMDLRSPYQNSFCGIPVREIPGFSFPEQSVSGSSTSCLCIQSLAATGSVTMTNTNGSYLFTGTDNYTTAGTLVSSSFIEFSSTDSLLDYSVDLSELVVTGSTGETRLVPLIYEPNLGQANIIPALGYNGIASLSRYSSILGGKYNSTSGPSNYSSIFGGKYNLLGSSDYAVLGGLSNVLSNSDFCTVFGGKSNSATTSPYSILNGGLKNELNSGSFSVIGGGYENKITNTGQYGLGFIGNGWQNTITGGGYGTILNGYGHSIIGVTNTYANIITQGFLNKIHNDGSTLSINNQDGWNTIGNGQNNVVTNSFQSEIGNGTDNTIQDSKYSTIVNGSTNNVLKSHRSIIGAGYGNTITTINAESDNYNGIFSGTGHDIISSGWSVVNGGYDNNIDSSDYASVGAGYKNSITNSKYSIIGGGKNNEINVEAGASNVICGGGFGTANNSIISANGNQAFMNFIGGGNQNDINAQQGIVNYSAIVGGSLNIIASSNQAFIGGGYKNNIGTTSVRGVVVGGENNNVYTSAYGFIGSGKNNDLSTAKASVVVGGINNNIFTSTYSGILGGKSNDITTNSNYSTIGGGLDNDITSTSTFGFIGGGKNHDIVTSTYISVLGGLNNDLNGANHSNIIGSNNSITTANYSNIIGGYKGTITNSSNTSIINPGGASITNSANATIISDKKWGTNYGGVYTGISGSDTSMIIGGVALIEGKLNYGGNTSIGGYYNHIKDSDYCATLAGTYGYFNNSKYSTIIGGQCKVGINKTPNQIIGSSNATIIGVNNLIPTGSIGTIILGSNITGSGTNTTYVNKFNIYDTPSTASTDNVLSRESNGDITLKDIAPRYYKAYGSGSYTYATGRDIAILLDWADESLNSGHFTAITGSTSGVTSGSLGNIFIQVDEDGVYDLDTFISYQGTDNSVRDRVDAMVRINDVRLQERSYSYNRDFVTSGEELNVATVNISTLVELSAGDTIGVEGYKQTTDPVTITEQWLTIKKL